MSETQVNGSIAGQLRSLVLTARVLAEYAREQGDNRSSTILDSVAHLLDLTVDPQIDSQDATGASGGAPVLYEQVAAAPR